MELRNGENYVLGHFCIARDWQENWVSCQSVKSKQSFLCMVSEAKNNVKGKCTESLKGGGGVEEKKNPSCGALIFSGSFCSHVCASVHFVEDILPCSYQSFVSERHYDC